MYDSVKQDQQEFLISNKDVIGKMLGYMKSWKYKVSKSKKGKGVIFLLKVLVRILKDSIDDQDLVERQLVFNGLQVI